MFDVIDGIDVGEGVYYFLVWFVIWGLMILWC